MDVLKGLEEIVYNLWWSWTPEVKSFFELLDPILWKESEENPIVFLHNRDKWEDKLKNPKMQARAAYLVSKFKSYMKKHSRYMDEYKKPVVFLCAEYGLHHSLLIYAGGLGFLAGDILKEASDLGFPMVGIGFMYPQGYVKQRIKSDGWQEDLTQMNQKERMPVQKVLDEEGNWLKMYVYVGEEKVYFGLWKVQVGKVPLYLIDTNIEENSPWNREISSQLYVPDRELRLKQQIVLGFGAHLLLKKLGIQWMGFHVNEDYPAFVLLADVIHNMKQGLDLQSAIEKTKSYSLFTTHTPISSAVNIYPFHMVERQFLFVKEILGLDPSKLLELGVNPNNPSEGFNTTVMAMRISKYVNAVSRKHRDTVKSMWGFIRDDVDYVTNGVHISTWLSKPIRELFKKYLGEDWYDLHDHLSLWELVDSLPDEELWRAHVENKISMINHIRERVRDRWSEGNADPNVLIAQGLFLDPDVLTICFARRMTSYKRPTLVLEDIERLKRILTNIERPVQIIFAGKAHPADVEGKKLIQQIFIVAKDPSFKGRIAFVEDYDEALAHYLVSGSDVWLNNPQPPLEASGTSGMKASINGVIHLSVLDGWWAEGYNSNNGWSFETPQELYNLLETQIVPLYYDRDERNIPRGWVKMMKEAIKSVVPVFSSRRMLKEYIDKFYSKMG